MFLFNNFLNPIKVCNFFVKPTYKAITHLFAEFHPNHKNV